MQRNTRIFSIASPPYEDNVLIAFRMRDTNFKNLILGLEPGAELLLDGPHSDFVLPHHIDAPVVFLAGGVGITPIRSILLQELHEQLLTTFYLFYSNHTPEDAPFLEELLSIKKSNVHIIPTITHIGEFEKFWNWEMGHITLNMIHKYVPDPSIPYYYIAGPPSFVNAMNTMLKNSPVETSRIVPIEFSGY
jgi:ferredoxin-NADP reductase